MQQFHRRNSWEKISKLTFSSCLKKLLNGLFVRIPKKEKKKISQTDELITHTLTNCEVTSE